jgi:hypothetical protein
MDSRGSKSRHWKGVGSCQEVLHQPQHRVSARAGAAGDVRGRVGPDSTRLPWSSEEESGVLVSMKGVYQEWPVRQLLGLDTLQELLDTS